MPKVTIGCDDADFDKFMDNPILSYDPMFNLYPYGYNRVGNHLTPGHVQLWKNKLLVSHDAKTPQNSGIERRLWLLAGKKHTVEIDVDSNTTNPPIILYLGYGHKLAPYESKNVVSIEPTSLGKVLGSVLSFQFGLYKKKTLGECLIADYNKRFLKFGGQIKDGKIYLDFTAPHSHEKGNIFVPLHIGLVFLNTAKPGEDMMLIRRFRVAYMDDTNYIDILRGFGHNLDVFIGKRNSPLKTIVDTLMGEKEEEFNFPDYEKLLKYAEKKVASTGIYRGLSLVVRKTVMQFARLVLYSPRLLGPTSSERIRHVFAECVESFVDCLEEGGVENLTTLNLGLKSGWQFLSSQQSVAVQGCSNEMQLCADRQLAVLKQNLSGGASSPEYKFFLQDAKIFLRQYLQTRLGPAPSFPSAPKWSKSEAKPIINFYKYGQYTSKTEFDKYCGNSKTAYRFGASFHMDSAGGASLGLGCRIRL